MGGCQALIFENVGGRRVYPPSQSDPQYWARKCVHDYFHASYSATSHFPFQIISIFKAQFPFAFWSSAFKTFSQYHYVPSVRFSLKALNLSFIFCTCGWILFMTGWSQVDRVLLVEQKKEDFLLKGGGKPENFKMPPVNISDYLEYRFCRKLMMWLSIY